MVRLAILFCVVLLSNDALAQRTRSYKADAFTFALQYDSSTVDGYEQCAVKSIAITRGKDSVQTITPEENIVTCDWLQHDFFVVEDMNFDGVNDFRLLLSMSPGGNTSYAYWLYNPTTKAFEQNSAYEDSLVNVRFDQERKLVRSMWSGGTEYGSETYKLENGKLVLTERETVTPEESGTTNYIRTVYKAENGTMKKASTERLTEEQFQKRE